jgi:CRISPR-associated endonuclease Cas1
MAASPNLPQFRSPGKSPISKSGILTIDGFGIRVCMRSGHLEIEDGIGPERRKIRLARVRHGLNRLILIGSDGFITLEALRWLADQDVAFVMLERNGKLICVTGPVRSSDARLRRAQALAGRSEVGLEIARTLIERKLSGQEQVVRQTLLSDGSADKIAHYRSALPNAATLDKIRLIESQAAATYWATWHNLPISFPRKDESRVPEHWRIFGTRFSSLSGSPRVAVNPGNAILNYLYALLCSESRLAATALGLDPGLGFLHLDTAARDSLACDLMEAVRPKVDAYLLEWITRDPLRREWFSEQPDGNCRLIASLAVRLSETASMWGRAVAPVAEWMAQTLWSSPRKRSVENQILATRLTQNRKRAAQGGASQSVAIQPPRRENICRECGNTIRHGNTRCGNCRIESATGRMADVARVGRLTAHSSQAQTKRSDTQRRNAISWHSWKASSQPEWLTEQAYSGKIQPLLAQVSGTSIARAIGVTCAYGSRIRRGSRAHPRHWQALARLVGVNELGGRFSLRR